MGRNFKGNVLVFERVNKQTANLEEIQKAFRKESKNRKITPENAEASARAWLEESPFDDLYHIKLQQLAAFMEVEDPYILAVLAHRVGLSYDALMEKIGKNFHAFNMTHREILCETADVVKELIGLIYDFEKQTLSDNAQLLFEQDPGRLFNKAMREHSKETEKLINLMNFMFEVADVSTDFFDIYCDDDDEEE